MNVYTSVDNWYVVKMAEWFVGFDFLLSNPIRNLYACSASIFGGD